MQSKKSENIADVVETAGKAVAKPDKRNTEATVLEVKPSETVSIVCGNKVLFYGSGLKYITIEPR